MLHCPLLYLIVLGDNHVSILGEVEVERRLVSAQIVDMEDEALIHTGPVTPHNPPHSRVYQPIPDMDMISENPKD